MSFRLQKELQDAHDRNTLFIAELDELRSVCFAKLVENCVSHIELNEIENELSELRAENTQQSDCLKLRESEISELRCQIENAAEELVLAKKDMEKLQAQSTSEKERAAHERQELNQAMKMKENEINGLNAQLESLKIEKEGLEMVVMEVGNKLKHSEHERQSEKESAYQKLHETMEDVRMKESQVSDLSAQIETLKTENGQLEVSLSNALKKLENLQMEAAKANEVVLQEASEKLKAQGAEITNLNAQIDQMKVMGSDLVLEAEKEIEKLQVELKHEKEEREGSDVKIGALEKELAANAIGKPRLEAELADSQTQASDLRHQLSLCQSEVLSISSTLHDTEFAFLSLVARSCVLSSALSLMESEFNGCVENGLAQSAQDKLQIEAEVSSLQDQLFASQSQLQSLTSTLQETESALLTQLSQIAILSTTLSSLEAENSEFQKQIQLLTLQNSEFQKQIEQFEEQGELARLSHEAVLNSLRSHLSQQETMNEVRVNELVEKHMSEVMDMRAVCAEQERELARLKEVLGSEETKRHALEVKFIEKDSELETKINQLAAAHSVVSEDLKKVAEERDIALQGVEQLKQASDKMQRELMLQITSLQVQLDQENSDKSVDFSELRALCDQREKELSLAREELSQLNAKIASLEGLLRSKEGETEIRISELLLIHTSEQNKVSLECEERRRELVATKEALSSANIAKSSLEAELSMMQSQMDLLTKDLSSLQTHVDRTTSSHQLISSHLTRELEGISAQLAVAEQFAISLFSQNAALSLALSASESQILEHRQQAESLLAENQNLVDSLGVAQENERTMAAELSEVEQLLEERVRAENEQLQESDESLIGFISQTIVSRMIATAVEGDVEQQRAEVESMHQTLIEVSHMAQANEALLSDQNRDLASQCESLVALIEEHRQIAADAQIVAEVCREKIEAQEEMLKERESELLSTSAENADLRSMICELESRLMGETERTEGERESLERFVAETKERDAAQAQLLLGEISKNMVLSAAVSVLEDEVQSCQGTALALIEAHKSAAIQDVLHKEQVRELERLLNESESKMADVVEKARLLADENAEQLRMVSEELVESGQTVTRLAASNAELVATADGLRLQLSLMETERSEGQQLNEQLSCELSELKEKHKQTEELCRRSIENDENDYVTIFAENLVLKMAANAIESELVELQRVLEEREVERRAEIERVQMVCLEMESAMRRAEVTASESLGQLPKLITEIERLNAVCGRLNEELESERNQSSEKDGELMRLKAEAEEQTARAVHAEIALGQSEEKCEGQQSLITELRADLECETMKSNAAEATAAQLQVRIDELEELERGLREELASANAKALTSDSTIQQLQAALSERDEEQRVLEEDVLRLRAQLMFHSSRAEAAHAIIAKFQVDLASAESQLLSQSNDIRTLNERALRAERALASGSLICVELQCREDGGRIGVILSSQTESEKRLKAVLASAQAENSALTLSLTLLESQNSELQQQLSQQDQTLSQKEAQIQNLSSQVEQLTHELSRTEIDFGNSQAETQRLKSELDELEKLVVELRVENSDLQQRLRDATHILESTSKSLELEKLKSTQVENEVEGLRNQLQGTERSADEKVVCLEQAVRELQSEKADLQKQLSEISEQHGALSMGHRSAVDQLQTLQSHNAAMESLLELAQQAKQQVEQAKEEAERECAEHKVSSNLAKAVILSLQKEAEEARAAKDVAEQTLKDVRAQLSAVESDLATSKDCLQKMSLELSLAHEKLALANSEHSQLVQSLNRQEKICSDLQNEKSILLQQVEHGVEMRLKIEMLTQEMSKLGTLHTQNESLKTDLEIMKTENQKMEQIIRDSHIGVEKSTNGVQTLICGDEVTTLARENEILKQQMAEWLSSQREEAKVMRTTEQNQIATLQGELAASIAKQRVEQQRATELKSALAESENSLAELTARCSAISVESAAQQRKMKDDMDGLLAQISGLQLTTSQLASQNEALAKRVESTEQQLLTEKQNSETLLREEYSKIRKLEESLQDSGEKIRILESTLQELQDSKIQEKERMDLEIRQWAERIAECVREAEKEKEKRESVENERKRDEESIRIAIQSFVSSMPASPTSPVGSPALKLEGSSPARAILSLSQIVAAKFKELETKLITEKEWHEKQTAELTALVEELQKNQQSASSEDHLHQSQLAASMRLSKLQAQQAAQSEVSDLKSQVAALQCALETAQSVAEEQHKAFSVAEETKEKLRSDLTHADAALSRFASLLSTPKSINPLAGTTPHPHSKRTADEGSEDMETSRVLFSHEKAKTAAVLVAAAPAVVGDRTSPVFESFDQFLVKNNSLLKLKTNGGTIAQESNSEAMAMGADAELSSAVLSPPVQTHSTAMQHKISLVEELIRVSLAQKDDKKILGEVRIEPVVAQPTDQRLDRSAGVGASKEQTKTVTMRMGGFESVEDRREDQTQWKDAFRSLSEEHRTLQSLVDSHIRTASQLKLQTMQSEDRRQEAVIENLRLKADVGRFRQEMEAVVAKNRKLEEEQETFQNKLAELRLALNAKAQLNMSMASAPDSARQRTPSPFRRSQYTLTHSSAPNTSLRDTPAGLSSSLSSSRPNSPRTGGAVGVSSGGNGGNGSGVVFSAAPPSSISRVFPTHKLFESPMQWPLSQESPRLKQ